VPAICASVVSALIVCAASPRGAARPLRQPEVEQLDALLGDEDVRGLEIPVRDAVPVRGIERSRICAAYSTAWSTGSGPASGTPSTSSMTR